MLKLTTPPEVEPLDLAEGSTDRTVLGEHLRVDVAAEIDTFNALVTSARQQIEDFTGRALITQQWTLYLDEFPYCSPNRWNQWNYFEHPPAWLSEGKIDIPRPPLQAVTSIRYTDGNGVVQTINSNLYQVAIGDEYAFVLPAYGQTWPSPRLIPNAIEVLFTAGYGDDGSAVPETIKLALKMTVGFFYENREDMQALPNVVRNLLWPYRDMRL